MRGLLQLKGGREEAKGRERGGRKESESEDV